MFKTLENVFGSRFIAVYIVFMWALSTAIVIAWGCPHWLSSDTHNGPAFWAWFGPLLFNVAIFVSRTLTVAPDVTVQQEERII